MRHGSNQAWHVRGGTFPPQPSSQEPMTGCVCDLPVLTANVKRGGRQTQQTNTRLAREMTTGSTSFALFLPTDHATDHYFQSLSTTVLREKWRSS